MKRREILFQSAACFFGAAASSISAAVRGKEMMYVGRTISKLPEATEGLLDTTDPKVLKFTSSKGNFDIPYEGVTSIEYGQKAGRRLGVALVISVWALFSKTRKHFLTISFNDAAHQPNGVVLELPKGTPKSIITTIEARSGRKCEYESGILLTDSRNKSQWQQNHQSIQSINRAHASSPPERCGD